jgi:hypothetical protein
MVTAAGAASLIVVALSRDAGHNRSRIKHGGLRWAVVARRCAGRWRGAGVRGAERGLLRQHDDARLVW